ncbi:unnamed protein product [Periconia digitata]|uniref:Uncharacterized protein n=1 Tax=Periconia digitata TaxID=1303443 RepID=A0A9W4U3S6_9PLEO|nr:unnamed protein product [Periconia digitata]
MVDFKYAEPKGQYGCYTLSLVALLRLRSLVQSCVLKSAEARLPLPGGCREFNFGLEPCNTACFDA